MADLATRPKRFCAQTFLKTWGQENLKLAKLGDQNLGTQNLENLGTSMISKSQEETEVSGRLEEKALEAEMRRFD